MRIRRDLWARLTLGAVGVCAIAANAAAQTVPGDQAVYQQGKLSPAPGTRLGNVQPAVPSAAPGRPRLTQPVTAGPEGLQQVSANEIGTTLPPTIARPAGAALASTPSGGYPTTGHTSPPAESLPPVGLMPGSSPIIVAPPVPSGATAGRVQPPAAGMTLQTPATPATPAPAGKTSTVGVAQGYTPAPSAGHGSVPPGFPPVSGLVAAPTNAVASTPPGTLPTKQSPTVTVDYEMPETVSLGQPFTYSLMVRNGGTAAVSGVRVEQELPAGAAYISSDPPGEMAGEGKLGWAIGQLEGNAEKRIKVTMKPAEEGELKGRASVVFATAVEARSKVTRPRVSLAVTGPDVVKVGERVAFQIKLSNIGTGPAQKIGLRAQFSDGLAHSQGPVLEADVSNLPAGGCRSLTLEVTAVKPGQQSCQFSAFVEGNTTETAKTTVMLVESQLVLKQNGPTRCLVKAEPTYRIELANPGTAATDPLQVWTVVPDGFEFVQATDGGLLNANNKTVIWKLNGLAAGTAKTVALRLRSVTQADGVVRTVAQAAMPVETPAGGIAQVGARGRILEARAETIVKSEGVPALRFEVLGAEGLVEVGKEAVYDIRVSNQGTGPCTNVQLVAELSEGTAPTKSEGPTLGRTSGQQILFDPISQLGVKNEAVYRVRVKGSEAGDMRFRVKLTCEQVKTPVVKEENTRFYKE